MSHLQIEKNQRLRSIPEARDRRSASGPYDAIGVDHERRQGMAVATIQVHKS